MLDLKSLWPAIGNIGFRRRRKTKQKHNAICVRHIRNRTKASKTQKTKTID
jgi:hypothetical protein